MKTPLRILTVLVAFLSMAAAGADDEATTTLTRVGQESPAFECTTPDGQKVVLAKLRGRVVLVNFLATWCGPCVAELPQLEKQVWQKFKTRKFSMLAIGREHDNQELKAFQKKLKLSFPLAGDPERVIYSQYAKQYIPRTCVIDAQGRIAFQSVGYEEADFARMVKVIERELEKGN